MADKLCEDKVRHERATEITDLIESKVLVYIIDLLERSGFSLEIFNLPAPKVEHLVVIEHHILREETEFDFHALNEKVFQGYPCLLYTSPSPRDLSTSRMPSSA